MPIDGLKIRKVFANKVFINHSIRYKTLLASLFGLIRLKNFKIKGVQEIKELIL